MKVSFIAVTISVLVLAGCASQAPKGISFSGDPEEAMILLVGPPFTSTFSEIFRQVSLDDHSFLKGVTTFRVGGIGGVPLLLNSKEEGLSAAVKAVPAGDYAVVESSRPYFSGYASGTSWSCFYRGVPVHRVEARKLNIIKVDTSSQFAAAWRKSDAEVETALARARRDYPDLAGDLVFAARVAEVEWPQTKGGVLETMNRNCAEPAQFVVVDTPRTAG